MAKKSTQKFKYLENKAKGIFHQFSRAFIEANKVMFFDGESPTLKTFNNDTIIMTKNSDKIRIL